jgi:hypothetical protein
MRGGSRPAADIHSRLCGAVGTTPNVTRKSSPLSATSKPPAARSEMPQTGCMRWSDVTTAIDASGSRAARLQQASHCVQRIATFGLAKNVGGFQLGSSAATMSA